MNRRTLSARERRALIIGGLTLGAILLGRCGVRPYMRMVGSVEREIARQREILRQELRAVRTASGYPQILEETVAQIVGFDARLLDAGTPSAARNGLVRLVERRLEEQPIRLVRMPAQEPKGASSGLAAVSVRIEAEGDVEGLVMLLASIESHPMILGVDQVDVRVVDRGRARGGDRAPPEVLAFGLTVTAFTWYDAAAASTASPSDRSTARPTSLREEQPDRLPERPSR